jgi:hypothetical protein
MTELSVDCSHFTSTSVIFYKSANLSDPSKESMAETETSPICSLHEDVALDILSNCAVNLLPQPTNLTLLVLLPCDLCLCELSQFNGVILS